MYRIKLEFFPLTLSENLGLITGVLMITSPICFPILAIVSAIILARSSKLRAFQIGGIVSIICLLTFWGFLLLITIQEADPNFSLPTGGSIISLGVSFITAFGVVCTIDKFGHKWNPKPKTASLGIETGNHDT